MWFQAGLCMKECAGPEFEINTGQILRPDLTLTSLHWCKAEV